MCSLAVSTLDSPAVEPRSTKILMSENLRLYTTLSAWPEVRGTADTDGGAYSPFRSILLVLTHDFIIIQLNGPACGDG